MGNSFSTNGEERAVRSYKGFSLTQPGYDSCHIPSCLLSRASLTAPPTAREFVNVITQESRKERELGPYNRQH